MNKTNIVKKVCKTFVNVLKYFYKKINKYSYIYLFSTFYTIVLI